MRDIVARRRERFRDGQRGWSGVLRQEDSMDMTVVGSGRRWMIVPVEYRVGAAGAHEERRYAGTITPEMIPEYDQ